MSELVSSDLQQVFAQQLLVLEKQRDSLLNQLDEQQKERSSFVDVLEEKHALEENLRSEKEQLAEKLRQTDILEKQLDDERVALQEQLIRQAKLNEIIREKDLLEKELTEQKNRLQVEYLISYAHCWTPCHVVELTDLSEPSLSPFLPYDKFYCSSSFNVVTVFKISSQSSPIS